MKIIAFLEAEYFDYYTLPLHKFLQALLEKEIFNIKYGQWKPESKKTKG